MPAGPDWRATRCRAHAAHRFAAARSPAGTGVWLTFGNATAAIGYPCCCSAWQSEAMGKTQYYTAATLDGFIADADNSLEWLFVVDREVDRFAEFFAGVGAFAMGATTYEWVLGHEQLLEHPDK